MLAVEESQQGGLLRGAELYLFTDNSTAEAAFLKGISTNRKLFELVLRLRKLQMLEDMIIHIVLISRARVIAQGTDGLSRGITTSGTMRRDDFCSFVPLHLSAL